MYTKDELLDAMVTCKQRHGKITTQAFNNDDDLPSGPTFTYRFDSMADAAEQAGMPEEAERLRRQKRGTSGYTDKEIQSFIKENSKNGKITPQEIKASDGPSKGTIRTYLETGKMTGEQINGIDIIPTKERGYVEKDEIIEKAKEVIENEGWLRINTLISNVSRKNILKYFDSINQLKEEVSNELEEQGMNPEKVHYTNKTGYNLENVFSDRYVYVLKSSDKDVFYVGKSSDLCNRLERHENNNKFDKIEKIIRVPESKDIQSVEENMSLEIAREYETTEVYGGK